MYVHVRRKERWGLERWGSLLRRREKHFFRFGAGGIGGSRGSHLHCTFFYEVVKYYEDLRGVLSLLAVV